MCLAQGHHTEPLVSSQALYHCAPYRSEQVALNGHHEPREYDITLVASLMGLM